MEAEQHSTDETRIRFLCGPLAERTISIQKPVTTLGRDAKNDIVILDPGISIKMHAFPGKMAYGPLKTSRKTTTSRSINSALKRAYFNITPWWDLDAIPRLFLLSSILSLISLQAECKRLLRRLHFPRYWGDCSLKKCLSMRSLPTKCLIFRQVENDPPPENNLPSLTISSNSHSNRQVHPLNQQELSIGRDACNDIVIADPIIPAQHAQIIHEGEHWFFIHPHLARDKTLNGLWYQGQHIRGDESFRKQLTNGDIFRIGDEHGTLITLTYSDGSAISSETPLQMRPIPLSAERLTIGRTIDNTVVLNHPQISGHHAVFEKVDEGYRIIDTNSTNHVYVNGQPVKNQLLHTGDELRIGPDRLIYTGTELKEYDENSHICIHALHLYKVDNNHNTLLHDISLVIPPRAFVALVGGSGTGKSTLMDALNGLHPAQKEQPYSITMLITITHQPLSAHSLAMSHRTKSSTGTGDCRTQLLLRRPATPAQRFHERTNSLAHRRGTRRRGNDRTPQSAG